MFLGLNTESENIRKCDWSTAKRRWLRAPTFLHKTLTLSPRPNPPSAVKPSVSAATSEPQDILVEIEMDSLRSLPPHFSPGFCSLCRAQRYWTNEVARLFVGGKIPIPKPLSLSMTTNLGRCGPRLRWEECIDTDSLLQSRSRLKLVQSIGRKMWALQSTVQWGL